MWVDLVYEPSLSTFLEWQPVAGFFGAYIKQLRQVCARRMVLLQRQTLTSPALQSLWGTRTLERGQVWVGSHLAGGSTPSVVGFVYCGANDILDACHLVCVCGI